MFRYYQYYEEFQTSEPAKMFTLQHTWRLEGVTPAVRQSGGLGLGDELGLGLGLG